MMQFILQYWVEVTLGGVTAGLAGLWTYAKSEHKKRKALEAGVQALLRDRLIQTCEHYLEAGSVPVYGLENIDSMYKAYHTLHGNGTVAKLVDDVKELPVRC